MAFTQSTARLKEYGMKKPFITLFILGLVIRIISTALYADVEHKNLYEHGEIAHNLYHGYGFTMHWPYESLDSNRRALMSQPPQHEGAFLPPVSPYLLYLSYRIFGETPSALNAMLILNILVSSCIPLAIYSVARRLGDLNTAFFSAVFSAVFLPAVISVTTFTGSVLYQLCALLIIIMLLKLPMERKGSRYALYTGILIGCMILMRSEYLLLGAGMIGIAIREVWKHRALSLMNVLSMIVPIILIVGPWTYRNYLVFDRFVPVLSHPWYEIWRGNNTHASGTTTDREGKSVWVHWTTDPEIVRAMDALPYDRYFEVRADSIFREDVIAHWKSDPSRYAVLAAAKIGMFFTYDMNNPSSRQPLYIFFSITATILILRGLWVLWMRRKEQGMLYVFLLFSTFYLYYLTLTAFTVMLPRYQIYVQTVMLALAFIPRRASGK